MSPGLRALVLTALVALELVHAATFDVAPSREEAERAVEGLVGRASATIVAAAFAIGEASHRIHRVVDVALAPLHRPFRLTQPHGVFGFVDRDVQRLRIEIDDGAGRPTIHLSGGGSTDEALSALVDHRRVSGVWNHPHGGDDDVYPRLAELLARRVLDTHPEARGVFVSVERFSIRDDPSVAPNVVFVQRIERRRPSPR